MTWTEPEQLLAKLSSLGVDLSIHGDTLRCQAPPGVLTPPLLERIRARKAELLGLLAAARPGAIPRADPVERRSRSLAYASSFPQSRLWFLDQLGSGPSAYNMPSLWCLRGELQPSALQSALSMVVERHHPLRTSFGLKDGVLLQFIHEMETSIALPITDLSGQASADRIEALLQEELVQPFDLTCPPLLRARLFRLGPCHHLLLLTIHHIAIDGWSSAILHREWAALYNAACRQIASPLPELPVHYADFSAWQQGRLRGERLRQLHSYWSGQLQQLPPLELPTDHPRPSVFRHDGHAIAFTLEPDLCRGLHELCHGEGATLQMGLLALIALLLHRYSRQEDFAIGVPSWGRDHPDLEPLIGVFVNTLVLRLRPDPALTFRALLQQVRATSLQAYQHQELPFEQLPEVLQGDRDRSRNPLVQVFLQLLDVPEPALVLDGLEVEQLPPPLASTRADLEFHFRAADQVLQGTLVHATALFGERRMRRLIGHLRQLLRACLASPDGPLGTLSMLSPGEREHLLQLGRGPAPPLAAEGVHHRFEAWAQRAGASVAVVSGDRKLSYGELNRRANQLAHLLRERGVGPEVIVAVCLERSPAMVIALLAVLKAGGAYLPLDPAWPDRRVEGIMADAGAPLLIADQPFLARRRAGAVTCLDLQDPALALSSRPSSNPGSPFAPGQLAYVLFTSGSTGVPKGVLVEHRSILRLVGGTETLAITADERLLQAAPLAFDAATFEIWGALLNGASLVLAPPGPLSLADLARLIVRQRISMVWLTSALFQAMVDGHLDALRQVRTVLAGGDVLSPAHVRTLLHRFPVGHRLINGYGPTENTTFTCCHVMEAGDHLGSGAVPIGRPIAHTHVLVLDPQLQPCPIGLPGDLFMGGLGLARGYLNQPELTADRFIADPFAADPSARLYRSGDLASWREEGTLAFHGRLDDQIKLRGYRIEPGEIEAVLMGHPRIQEACVVCRDDPAGSRQLVAYWRHRPAEGDQPATTADDPTPEQLRTLLARDLPEPLLPAAFVRLEAFPLTASGKLDRGALPPPDFGARNGDRIAPRSPLELRLHHLWQEVLGHADFGVHDNFFALGGHSLAAARLVDRLDGSLGLSLPLGDLFSAPTIAELATRLLTPDALSRRHCVVPLQAQGTLPPLFVFHGKGGDVFGFLDLARALAPSRPVFGVQAIGRSSSIEAMARRYADELRRCCPLGPYHLIGFSAGGWMAYATAAALLEQGVTPGLVALLDTQATARVHRRLVAGRVMGTLISRISPRLLELLALQPAGWPGFLRARRRGLRRLLRRLERPGGAGLEAGALGRVATRQAHDMGYDDHFLNLHGAYRPPRLPIDIHVFCTPGSMRHLRGLWRFYARGVIEHPLFERHIDYTNPRRAPQLAAELSRILALLESGDVKPPDCENG